MKNKRKAWAALATLFLLALLYVYAERSGSRGPAAPADPAAAQFTSGDDRAILDAFARRQSGIMVQTVGTVDRLLADDLEGSRHQRFIVRLESGHTLLVSHNIDIAPRIPLDPGDTIELRGQYEWNDRGGVVHWTHHDPDGDHPGGWIRHADRLYE